MYYMCSLLVFITDQMFVFFPEDEKVNIKTIKTYCQRMQEENITRAIIIVQASMTPSAKQVVIRKIYQLMVEIKAILIEYYRIKKRIENFCIHP